MVGAQNKAQLVQPTAKLQGVGSAESQGIGNIQSWVVPNVQKYGAAIVQFDTESPAIERGIPYKTEGVGELFEGEMDQFEQL